MRELLGGITGRRRRELGERSSDADEPVPVQDPYPFRAQPQVDGAVHDALAALEVTVGHELNFAGENALVVDGVALPNGNPHAAPLASAIDGLRTALASSAALIAARVSTLLDSGLTGLPPFLTRPGRAGAESGALVLEYTAHAAVAEVRSLVTPVAAQTVSVSRGVESHSSLAPTAVRRARETLDALRVAVACELVVAVRGAAAGGPRARRRPVAVAGRDRGARPRAGRPAARAGRRGRPQADRGLGGRTALSSASARPAAKLSRNGHSADSASLARFPTAAGGCSCS